MKRTPSFQLFLTGRPKEHHKLRVVLEKVLFIVPDFEGEEVNWVIICHPSRWFITE
jgi:hypothetical protein